MGTDQSLPDETGVDPSSAQNLESGKSEALPPGEQADYLDSSLSRATGEHPSVYAAQGEEQKLATSRTGHERTSSPQAENEPEDNLPDFLDRK